MTTPTPPAVGVGFYEAEIGILPVRIRSDLVVRIWGIPHDMTAAEAERISRVVMAFATALPEQTND